MNVDKRLLNAIEKMKTGDKNAFLVFYNKTFQLCCIRASRIMADQVRRDDFLSEFYPYVLLHINELPDPNEIYPWLEQVIPVFYELWSGEALYEANRPLHPDIPDEDHIRISAITVWERINEAVSFPMKEHTKKIPLPVILIGFLSILTLLGCLLLLRSEKSRSSDPSRIDQINQENMDFVSEMASEQPEIEGLYTETTTEVIIEGGTERE